ncbi:class I SAM-dependent methyltransferase [uncultured Marinobacter sp.]|uniref:class I SAM-dependent methyltransferase n=1 Tax=uncultured Marinobacter sp. TaxID=187379 RepID=UPI002636F8E6|nr:class I SAM-dependent methyltransferase [uncultured Marinobacter sp.]
MSDKDHWDQVYSINPTEKLGWYEPHLQISLDWIKGLGLPSDAPIIDVGGGASTLVDDLLDAGYRLVSVLDLSDHALTSVKTRLGKRAGLVTWLTGDITAIDMPMHYYELWHDRAVFHFLTRPEQQQTYRDNLLKALNPGGHVIIGTFAPEAPPKCSGLPVRRYSPEQLESTFGREFELQRHHKTLHITPSGVEQMYLYCHFRKKILSRCRRDVEGGSG